MRTLCSFAVGVLLLSSFAMAQKREGVPGAFVCVRGKRSLHDSPSAAPGQPKQDSLTLIMFSG